MFRVLFLVVILKLITFSVSQNTDYCKTLSGCIDDGEKYYKSYRSLIDQQKSVNPPPAPKTPYAVCQAELANLQTEMNDLNSQKSVYLVECLSKNADKNLVKNASISKFNDAVAAYVKATVNQTSPTENVKLSVCKCEQSSQISAYSKLCSDRRALCNKLTITCNQVTICTNEFLKNKNETVQRQNALQKDIVSKSAACLTLNAPTTQALPVLQQTTKAPVKISRRKRDVDQDPEPAASDLLEPVIETQGQTDSNEEVANAEEPVNEMQAEIQLAEN